jgi:DNA-binding winged helix-turn-helix (wHTH) protein
VTKFRSRRIVQPLTNFLFRQNVRKVKPEKITTWNLTANFMLYSIGLFILDTEKEVLLLESTQEVISKHSRICQVLSILVDAYPKTVTKNELTKILWPEDDVTEWALSRQISQLRQLLSAYDTESQYIKTVHTKGFKLEIEPKVIDSKITEHDDKKIDTQQNDSPSEASRKKYFITPLAITSFILCLLFIFLGSHLTSNTPAYGEITPKKNIIFPLNANWASSKPDIIQYTNEGMLIEPIGPDSLFVSTSLSQAAFYQGAIFSIKMKVNQEFVDNKGWLRLYYQTTLEGWPGEWDCGVADSIIETLDFEYHCVIDEKGSFTKVLANEPVNLGIKIHQLQPIGHAIIKSAAISIPANISTDRGWRTTNGKALDYNRGVSYHPTSVADQLSTAIKGPIKISGSKIAFTINIDDSYKKPDFVLQLFVNSKDGKWQDCFVSGADITSNVFTKICHFQNIQNPFMLNENEKVEIGIRPYGNIISGELKIIGLTVIE